MRLPRLARWLVSVLLLALGYADLIRGGITISAACLALAYCAAIPWAILGSLGGTEEKEDRRNWVGAGVAVACVLALYVFTLAPSTTMWDTSEYMTAAYVFGLPHPPGNPLFVILGRFFSLLPLGGSVAVRINVLAALSGAVSAGVWFLVAARVARRAGAGGRMASVAGALAALVSATAFTVWNQSVVNEKVYTIALVGIAIISWQLLRWSENPDAPNADARLVLVAYLVGLGYANHMAGALPVPAAGLLVLAIRPRTLMRWRTVTAALLAALLGLSPYATQPIRSAHRPAINEGEPTACREGLKAACTFTAGTWRAFKYNFNREQYGKPTLSDRQAPFSAQIGMWWMYFRWQWLRDAHGEHQRTQAIWALLFFSLALAGARYHWKHDRTGFWYFGPLMLTMSLVLIYYLNFKYGASQEPLLDVPHEVRDRDYFYLWSFSALGVWIGLGLFWVWRSLAAAVARRTPRLASFATAPVLAIAVFPLVGNWSQASRRGDQTTIAFAKDLLNSVEPYGILVTGGDNDTFPLWYAQEVEGVRRDVTVAVLSLMNTDWFGRGLLRRPVYPYDAARGPAVYRDRQWPMPTKPVMNLTFAGSDSVPDYFPVRQPLQFSAKGLDLTIRPEALPRLGDTPILERADMLVLRMIADGWPERPVFISRTTGPYPSRLGLDNHTVAQGLARKVVLDPAAVAGSVHLMGSGWLDVPRSQKLWDAFQGPQAVIAHGSWVDVPSISTVYAYLVAGTEIGQAHLQAGDTSAAGRINAVIAQVSRTSRIDQLLQPASQP